MKQPTPSLKILALATSIALAAGYVVYRVANARSSGAPASSTPAPAAPKGGPAGAPDVPVEKPDVGSVPMMGGSKSLAPLIEPKDLYPKPSPDAPAPTAPAPAAPR